MKVLYSEQMNILDQKAVTEYKIPGLILMEHASLALEKEIVKQSQKRAVNKVIICCGIGNNGGDGLALARQLLKKKIEITVFLLGNPQQLKKDSQDNYIMISKQLDNMYCLKNNIQDEKNKMVERFQKELQTADLIVDALLGTGLDRSIEGIYDLFIHAINESLCTVLAVDIPSGVQGNTGKILSRAVQADSTVTFQLPKVGNVIYPGAYNNGKLMVVDIGIPEKLIDKSEFAARISDADSVKKWVRRYRKDDHKGCSGTVLIIAGVKGMTGATVLAAKSAMKSGAGLVRIACEESLVQLFEQLIHETTTIGYPIDKDGHLLKCAKTILQSQIDLADVVVIGPGWGSSKSRRTQLEFLLQNCQKPLILDADALNILSDNMELFAYNNKHWVLTPHPGEMARLTGLSVEEVNQNRLDVAKNFAEKWNTTLVLKGANTIIVNEKQETWINTTGNPGMAAGGSGDVLAGIIASLCCRTETVLQSAVAGAFLHGLTGDLVADEKGKFGMTSGDLIEYLPNIMKKIIE